MPRGRRILLRKRSCDDLLAMPEVIHNSVSNEEVFFRPGALYAA